MKFTTSIKSSSLKALEVYLNSRKGFKILKNEFKNLKLRSQMTGEEGFKKLKQGFPYYDYLDTIIGQRDSVDPSKMQIESAATFSESSDSSETNQKSKEVQIDKGDSKF